MHRQRDFLLLVTLVAAATPTLGQDVVPAVGSGTSGAQSAASAPDFSGIWAHPSSGFEPLASGPGPVVNKSRLLGAPFNGVSHPDQLVGDYTNPILKPQAVEVVKRHGQIELSGKAAPSPMNQCWPQPVPYIFTNVGMQMLQQPDKITILYSYDNEVRHVRMNQPHPVQVTDRPYAMVDVYGTPYSHALHVVERYRLLDYQAAKEGLERNAKENFDLQRVSAIGLFVDRDYRGKHLQLRFTVEDEGVFAMPWSATVTYRPGLGDWPENVCAENTHEYYNKSDSQVPRADKADF